MAERREVGRLQARDVSINEWHVTLYAHPKYDCPDGRPTRNEQIGKSCQHILVYELARDDQR